jgi:hypothetical protein
MVMELGDLNLKTLLKFKLARCKALSTWEMVFRFGSNLGKMACVPVRLWVWG